MFLLEFWWFSTKINIFEVRPPDFRAKVVFFRSDLSRDRAPKNLKMLYLRDYLELVGQPVHRYISVWHSGTVEHVSGALRMVLTTPIRKKWKKRLFFQFETSEVATYWNPLICLVMFSLGLGCASMQYTLEMVSWTCTMRGWESSRNPHFRLNFNQLNRNCPEGVFG